MAITYFSYFASRLRNTDWHYVFFVGSSTLLLYSLHRIIGIQKTGSHSNQGRFAIIIKYKSHLIIYSVISLVYCIYAYYTFDWNRRILLIIPALLSLGYSLPIFIGGKRLRDFHWIKIFLIAFCWAVITFTIPIFELHTLSHTKLLLLTVERVLFIFAITIPFDIRDRKIDASNKVKTLASRYDNQKLQLLSFISLGIAAIIAAISYYQYYFLPSLITYAITAYLICEIDEDKNDYFYTGKMDGILMLPIAICMFWKLSIFVLQLFKSI